MMTSNSSTMPTNPDKIPAGQSDDAHLGKHVKYVKIHRIYTEYDRSNYSRLTPNSLDYLLIGQPDNERKDAHYKKTAKLYKLPAKYDEANNKTLNSINPGNPVNGQRNNSYKTEQVKNLKQIRRKQDSTRQYMAKRARYKMHAKLYRI